MLKISHFIFYSWHVHLRKRTSQVHEQFVLVKSLCDRDNFKFTWVISDECDSVIDKFTNYIYNVVH